MPRNPDVGNIIKTVFKFDRSAVSEEFQELIICVNYIEQHITEMNFLRDAKTKNRISTYINCGCNYSAAVEQLNKAGDNLNYQCLTSTVCYANTKLRSTFGDVCKMIKNPTNENVEYLSRAILLQENKVGLIDELKKYADKTLNTNYELQDCEKEIMLLMLLCSSTVQQLINNVDDRKLRYLVTLLEFPIKNAFNAWKLESRLNSEKIIEKLSARSIGEFFC